MALLNSADGKKIKHLNENILWVTDRHDGALVHYVTVYIPPNNEEKVITMVAIILPLQNFPER